MQIGFVGLGKMGGNMVHRIQRDSDHEVVAFDFNEERGQRRPRATARPAPSSLEDLVAQARGAAAWSGSWSRRATRPQETVDELAELLDEGDTIVDGGNSQVDRRQARAPRRSTQQGIHYVDVGTSRRRLGPRGRLLHDGRRPRRGGRAARADPRRARPAATEEHGPGWGHFGADRRGHYVKMVHNGVEYGMMQAYAEGFDARSTSREFELDNAKIAHLWMQGSVVRSWLCELAARAFEQEGNDLDATRAATSTDSGEGRWTIEDAIDQRRADAGDHRRRCTRASTRAATATYAAKVIAALRNQFGGHAVNEHGRGDLMAADVTRRAAGAGENPLVEGLERLPVHPTTLVDLRRHRRPRPPQAAAGALQPRPRGRAARALQPDRRLAPRACPTRSSATMAREAIEQVLAPRARREVLDALLEQRALRAGHVRRRRRSTSKLGEALDEFDEEAGEPLNRAFYLSTAPEFFPVIVEQLGDAGLNHHEDAEVRVRHREAVRHRPRVGARAQPQRARRVFGERQVFRIDHYLGKETVQNMLAFRFANGMFEPIWNRNYIDHVQITAAEDIGIGTRAGYYDHAGALRDLVQNHMLQLLTLLCMEPPASLHGRRGARREGQGAARDHAADARGGAPRWPCARSTRPGVDRRRGRAAATSRRRACPDDSRTETYAALRLEVDNWRWAGVPFYLRTGKRLARKVTEIAVRSSRCRTSRSSRRARSACSPTSSILTVQPNEGVSLSLGAKIPGTRMRIRPVNMEFLYGTSFLSQSPEAYERLIIDAMRGDATLFTRNDEVEAQWRSSTRSCKAWKRRRRARCRSTRPARRARRRPTSCSAPGDHWRAL